MASKMAAYQGVDLSNIPRHNLYATPRTPTSSSSAIPRSPARLSTAYSATASSRSKTTTTTNSSHAYSGNATSTGTGAGHASNAGRKRSRTSQSPAKRPSCIAPAASSRTATPIPTSSTAPIGRGGDGSGGASVFSAVHSSTVLPSDYQTPGFVSPAPLANSQYSLAQGFDTPTAAQADAYERPAFSAEAERTRLFTRLRDDELDRPTYADGLDGARDVAGPLARGRNGNGQDEAGQNGFWSGEDAGARAEATVQHFQSYDQRWSVRRALYNTVTGVAGVVFHFCTAGAFRGFTAGGGQGWAFGGGDHGVARPALSENEKSHLSMEDSWQDMDFVQDQEMPFAAPDSPVSKFASARSSPAGTPRAAKKIKSSYGDDGGLRNNWILVGEDETPSGSRPASPANSTTASPAGLRRASMIVTPTNRRKRFTATMSMPVNGTGGFSSTKQASSAALRSPGIRRELNTTPLRDGQRPRAGSTRTSAVGVAGGIGSMSGAGTGMARSVELKAAPQSPIAKDTERLLRIKAKREREEDREILRMNQRLEEMIRQGREALHTRYEVEELDESGGDDSVFR